MGVPYRIRALHFEDSTSKPVKELPRGPREKSQLRVFDSSRVAGDECLWPDEAASYRSPRASQFARITVCEYFWPEEAVPYQSSRVPASACIAGLIFLARAGGFTS